jgi:hypothetical protein
MAHRFRDCVQSAVPHSSTEIVLRAAKRLRLAAAPCPARGGPSFAELMFAKGGAIDFVFDFDIGSARE